MKRILFASAALLLACPVYAQQVGGDVSIPAGLTNGNFQNGVNAAISTGQIGSTSRATGGTATAAGGSGGAGGAGGSSRSASAGGNASGSVANSNTFTSPSTIRNTPSATLALATAYCQNSGGVGGSGPGFSFTAAFGKHDADCVRFNQAMALEALGEREAALLVLANSREVNAALTEARKRAATPRQAAVVPVAMNPATARDPRPNRQQCGALRRLADPSQVQRDYLAANCG